MRIIGLLILGLMFAFAPGSWAQELNARVIINHQKVQGTNVSIFETLQTALSEFINDRQWTSMQYARNERIECTFNITVNKYIESENRFDCSLLIQSIRPVYNSSYTTTAFSIKDPSFSFTYQEFDKLEFRTDIIDNDLTALIGYYVYLIIGIDLDTMSPLGGTDALQTVMTITNGAQSLNSKGWKAFDDSKNRFAIINDYLDGGMEPFRKMQYKYHREGLDTMSENPERGRSVISDAMGLLKQAHENKPLSMLPQIFTEYKRDELVNLYKGKGTANEKESLYDLLMSIDASQSNAWQQIKSN